MLTILLVALGMLPSLIWLLFYLREDSEHPEPKTLILYTFIAGALVTLLVLGFQFTAHDWLATQGVATYSFISFLFLAGIEEFFKFFAVYLTVSKRKEFDEPIDAMVYMIVASLGFATVENIGSIFQASAATAGGPGPLETTVLRFVGATLLHTLSSGVVGYYWGKAIAKHGHYGLLVLRGLLTATLLHAVFNYLIIKSEPLALPLIFLLFVGMFVLSDFEKLKHPKEIAES
jgi:protease PrsW